MIWPMIIALLLLGICWSALAGYALREFSYSKLEELCQQHKVPERFSQVLKQQDSARLALELMLTMCLLCFAALLCFWIGWPKQLDGTFSSEGWWRFTAEYVLSAIIVLLAADVLPWTIARLSSEPFLFHFWPMIRGVQTVMTPLLWLARSLDETAGRIGGRTSTPNDEANALEEEIRTVVDEGQREGTLQSSAQAMIHRVIELRDEDVGAIMTPRTQMFCLNVECTVEEARQQLIESGHSRIPIIGESTDDIIGMLYAKDLLKALEPNPPNGRLPILREIVREPFYVPETTGISALLEMMQRDRLQIAIVLDEYGGVAGLVTMEDILEEIVGEIADEYDVDEESPQIQQSAPDTIEVDARVHLDDLNHRFEFGLPEDGEFDTIGGFVFSQLGRLPQVGESITWEQLTITVLAADKRKLTRLKIQSQTPSETENLTNEPRS